LQGYQVQYVVHKGIIYKHVVVRLLDFNILFEIRRSLLPAAPSILQK
jgi:hypothetical protein